MKRESVVDRSLVVVAGVLLLGAAAVPGAELLGFYEFEGNFDDSSAAGNDPTSVNGGVTFGAGFGAGQAAVFAGAATGNGVSVPIDINPGVRPNLTIGAWVNATTAADNAAWGNDDGGWDRGLDARGGTWQVSNGEIFNTGIAAGGGWQFVAVTYRGGATNTYVDGSVFSQAGFAGGGRAGLAIGSLDPDNAVGTHAFNGSIDNFFVYDDALTAPQIESIRAAGPGAIAQTLAAPTGRATQQVWNFESGDLTGWSVVDTTHGDNAVFSSGGQPADKPGDNANIAATAEGDFFVRTWDGEAGGLGFADGPTGILESEEFILGPGANFEFLVGGGSWGFTGDPDAPGVDITAFTLEIEVAPDDWEVAMDSSGVGGVGGADGNLFREGFWDASLLEGENARLRIYDTHSGGWGHIDVDNVRYSTIPEPTVLGLLSGVLGLMLIFRRRS